MLRLEILPAGCGDCLWLEYGTPPTTRIVIIDGGFSAHALRNRIEAALKERHANELEIELLVVTHLDNDHILGVLELMKDPALPARFKDIWFNGYPQLIKLPPVSVGDLDVSEDQAPRSSRPADVLGGDNSDDEESNGPYKSLVGAADLLGRQDADQFSQLLISAGLPCNVHEHTQHHF